METVFSLLLVAMCFMVLVGVRNGLVYRIRMQAITEIFSHKDWQEKMNLLDDTSYFAMVFNLTKWTFKGFFPEHHARRVAREIASSNK